MHSELSFLGWSPFFEERWSRVAEAGWVPARIAAEHRGAYQVWSAAGSGMARLAGKLRHALGEEAFPGVGDWVALEGAMIQRVLERRTAFIRGAAGRESRGQVVAANVDLVFVVCGLDADYSVRRIERYAARVWASGAQPVVVLNKADVADAVEARTREVQSHAPGADVLAISALRGDGIDALRGRVGAGMTAALVGSSGAGKSTLANALLGEARMPTQALRPSDGTGQHTTTHRQLLALPGGGLLLDTPGMRELQLFDAEGLDSAFDDIAALAAGCRFSDCGHGDEPGCAVRAGVESGELDADRLEHFLQLEREARAYQRRHDQRLRREDERKWGRITREAQRVIRAKRGEPF